MIKFPVDDYEVKARYAPAIIVSAPFIVTLLTCLKVETIEFFTSIGTLLSVMFWYLMTFIVRYCGKNVECKLWSEWGGPPSAVIILWGNKIISDDIKLVYRKMVEDMFMICLPSRDRERNDLCAAIEDVNGAFLKVRSVIRKYDPNGLWVKANSEYGFLRNIYGSRWLWACIAISMTMISGYMWWENRTRLHLFGVSINFVMSLSSFIFGFYISPRMVKDVAFRYAEAAWESFSLIR